MNLVNNTLTRSVVLGITVFAASASAASTDSRLQREVDTCVSEIAAHANYSDADRVRHSVMVVKRRMGGHTLKIGTAVYGEDEAIREYATSCVVVGDSDPIKFSIRETSNGA